MKILINVIMWKSTPLSFFSKKKKEALWAKLRSKPNNPSLTILSLKQTLNQVVTCEQNGYKPGGEVQRCCSCTWWLGVVNLLPWFSTFVLFNPYILFHTPIPPFKSYKDHSNYHYIISFFFTIKNHKNEKYGVH